MKLWTGYAMDRLIFEALDGRIVRTGGFGCLGTDARLQMAIFGHARRWVYLRSMPGKTNGWMGGAGRGDLLINSLRDTNLQKPL